MINWIKRVSKIYCNHFNNLALMERVKNIVSKPMQTSLV